ncbi:TRAFAC class myosin-kinesin ATPase super [Ancistrocladus abbreviatus]
MKQPRIPFSREAHHSSDLLSSPNPGSNKHKASNRKQKCPKENSDPNTLPDSLSSSSPSLAGKPPAGVSGKIKSPLPPRPPAPSSNPLKRKLSVDAVCEIGACSFSSSDSGVKVIVRMRPLNKDEEGGEMIVQKLSNDSLLINGQTFTFDSIADAGASQASEDIFQLVGAPLVENCLAGFNSSVFAYGQTGSGKTYTMWGPANALSEENLSSDQQGLTPRVFQRLFFRINEEQTRHVDKQLKYQCRCSFLEIYNEQITDLLDPSQKNLQIREDVKSGVYVENLTEECVSNMKDVICILLKGLSNRRTGATSINAESSRSHSVFTCVVESRCKSMADGLSSFKTSRINLVDLAGSERQKLTGVAGERLKEAGNINRSLSQLGNLINILAEVSQTGKQRHIPYRDSRLTFLLQESLGGNAKLAMICAISPAQSCKNETFSTLRFAQRAKAIKNKAVVNEIMQDDVNFLREVIRQLKDELLRMREHGNQTDPNGAYSNGWNARRSLNLLKFSLNHPTALPRADDDGDEVMEIDEEAVEKVFVECGLQPPRGEGQNSDYSRGLEPDQPESEVVGPREASGNGCTEKQDSEVSDVGLDEGISEIADKNEVMICDNVTDCTRLNPLDDHCDAGGNEDKITVQLGIPRSAGDSPEKLSVSQLPTKGSPIKPIRDSSASPFSDSVNGKFSEAVNNSSKGSQESVTPSNLSISPCDVPQVLQSPTPSVSPRVISSSRKSLRTSSMLTASQKDPVCCDLWEEGSHVTSSKNPKEKDPSHAVAAHTSKISLSKTEYLAASLHRGLEIIDSHQHSSPLRHSPFRFSFKPADLKQLLPVEKVDVGVQTLPQDNRLSEESGMRYLCSSCKNRAVGELKESNENSNLQLVPIDGSLSGEQSKKQVPKAVEKVLTGAIRREMALEEFCAKQTSEIVQLNRLVQQYKYEREGTAVIGQMREDKIIRLENLMDGVLPTEDFLEEELISLKKEHEILKEKYENHPEVLRTKIELKRAQDELERYRNFFDMGERDVLLEEIQDLRAQLQYYIDNASKPVQRSSFLQLTYASEPSSSPPLNTIPESSEENMEDKLEQERLHWTEMESKWISLAEELRVELDASRSVAEKLKQEVESEKKCSEELKEALQLAMEGHARMLEQYADLEEKHMQLLARHRNIQEGIDDVKRAAARAGVRGAESKFINALAGEISALKVEREKERRYLRDENKVLQAQLRDTAEAVQAAGELLVRLKEAEEAVAAAQNRAAAAEEETGKAHKQMNKLKKKHEKEIGALNQKIADYHLSKQKSQDVHPNMAKYDVEDQHNADDQRWKQEFKQFYDGRDADLSKFGEPSSWFSGYDRCNI